MKKLFIFLILFCSIMLAGNACVSNNTVSNNWTTASTWSGCGNASSIVFDAAEAGPYAGSGTSTWTHTTGSGSNRILLVFVASNMSATEPDGLTGVTYGGTALTYGYKYHGTKAWNYVYYMYAPPTGAASVVVSSTTEISAAALSYSGAAQSGQFDNAVGATASSTTPTISLLKSSPNALIVAMFSAQAGYGTINGTARAATWEGEVVEMSPFWPAPITVSLTEQGSASWVMDMIAVSLIPTTSTAGTIPQTADTVKITTPVTINTSPSVVSILIEGAIAQLTTDGNAHTVTTTGGIQIEEGCTTISGVCTTANALDTSTGSIGNEITWVRTGMTTGQYLLENDNISPFTCGPICPVNINLSHSIFQAGSGGVYIVGLGGGSLIINNSEVINGERGFTVGGVTTLTLNNISSTGMTNTGALVDFLSDVPTTCLISNLTWINTTSNQHMISGTGDWSACLVTGNAMLTDSGGVYNPQFLHFDSSPAYSAVWTYNLAKGYYTSGIGASYGIEGYGTSSKHFTLKNNVLDGFQNLLGSYVDLIGNICIYLPTNALQGCMFFYNKQFITSTNDVYVMPTASNGNIMFYIIGQNSPTGGATLTNDTFIGTLSTSSGNASESGPTWGESTNPSVGNAMSNTILYGQNYNAGENMNSGHQNTFVTAGTDSVGVWNNNYFGALSGGWQPGGQIGINVDDGTHHHPNALYGDTALDPKFITTYRSWAQCDAILGGTGTEINLFNQLFNRWNNTNPVKYTAQNIYNCMRAGYAPRDIRLGGKGAVNPVLIFTGAQ